MVSVKKIENKSVRLDCRRVELDYSRRKQSGKIIKDYNPSSSNYYELKLGPGRVFTERFRCKEDNISTIIANLKLQREMVGVPDIGDGRGGTKIISVKTRIAEMVAQYHSFKDDKEYVETVLTAPIFQPPSWITEDMMTTYFHYLTGWDTEINPEGVGFAVGPSDFVDLAKQHHRWFKGGPECYLDMKKYLDAYPALKHSMQGYSMQQAFLWPLHTLTDELLYYVPAVYWAGQILKIGGKILKKGIIPFSTNWIFIPVFGWYFYYTLKNYIRPMALMGVSFPELWRKEAMLSIQGPVYEDAVKKAVLREPLEFAATAAGDRKMLSYEFLKGIKWKRNLSKVTTLVGTGISAGLVYLKGGDLEWQTYAGLGFNVLFPLLRWGLLSSGIKDQYSYPTSYDTYLKENLELEGAGYIKVSEHTPDTRLVTFKVNSKQDAERAINRLSGNLGAFTQVKNYLAGIPGTAGFAEIASQILAPDNAAEPNGPRPCTWR